MNMDKFILILDSELNFEAVEMAQKITALEKFLGHDNFKKLSDVHQVMIKHQLKIMRMYLDLIYERRNELNVDLDN